MIHQEGKQLTISVFSYQLPNILANNVEESLSLLSKMESRLEEAQTQNADGNDKIKRRLNRAKLVSAIIDDDTLSDLLFSFRKSSFRSIRRADLYL